MVNRAVMFYIIFMKNRMKTSEKKINESNSGWFVSVGLDELNGLFSSSEELVEETLK